MIDARENRWFPIASAAIKRRSPEVHASLLLKLAQVEGFEAINTVDLLVERYDALTGKTDAASKEAIVILATRFENPAAARFAQASGGSFSTTSSMDEAFEGAHVVYPKSWAPAWVMRERTRLLRGGETAKLAELEQQALAENAKHRSWECTEERMAKTHEGRALYMHCLPADITGLSCKAGEVSAGVFERARLDTYREASHKPFAIAAMILATRFENPGAVLAEAIESGRRSGGGSGEGEGSGAGR